MITKEMINDHPSKYLIKFDNAIGYTGYEYGLMETITNMDDSDNSIIEIVIIPFSSITGALLDGVMLKINEAIEYGHIKVI
jgi:hypothetical protein